MLIQHVRDSRPVERPLEIEGNLSVISGKSGVNKSNEKC